MSDRSNALDFLDTLSDQIGDLPDDAVVMFEASIENDTDHYEKDGALETLLTGRHTVNLKMVWVDPEEVFGGSN